MLFIFENKNRIKNRINIKNIYIYLYMNSNINIVVARYNENLEWTKQFSNVIVYNKGLELKEEYNQIMLNNVGREGHSYYKYIYDNYDNLNKYTIFLQGNPFDHSPNIIQNIYKYFNTELNIDFEFLSETILYCNINGCYGGHGPMREVYEKIFDDKKRDYMELFPFGAGAQFIVSKEQILKRSKEFYLKIVNLLNNEIHPMEGFVIERYHKLIFV
jgi:hypothetical protein